VRFVYGHGHGHAYDPECLAQTAPLKRNDAPAKTARASLFKHDGEAEFTHDGEAEFTHDGEAELCVCNSPSRTPNGISIDKQGAWRARRVPRRRRL
jgi:hypothetical protein